MAGWGNSPWGSAHWGSVGSPSEHIPTSPEFPSADVDSASTIAILPDYIEVSATKGAPWIVYDPTALGLRIMDDGNAETAISIDLETSESWTLEVTFRPDRLPPDLSNLDIYRLFIGAYDMQGPGCGLVISRAGLAIVSAPTGAAFPIPGSQSLIPEGSDYYTIRIAVSAELDVTNIYVTKTDLIPIKGHQLRFTTGAIQSPPDSSNGVVIATLGTGSIPAQITVQTVRFNGHAMMVPNQRPVAVPGTDQGVSVGATVRFDGSGSYDPEGSPLTYFWSLIDAPDGSQFKISSVAGSTSPDFNADGFTYFFYDSEGSFSVDKAPVLQPGDTLLVGGQQYTVAVGVVGQTPMWTLDLRTSKWVRNIVGGGWIDDNTIAITAELLPDNLSNQAWVICHSATFFSDQTHATPDATPDAAGLYEPQLVVNDGELDSIPEFALLNVSQTSLTLGEIPDVSFIWRHLSDFWNLLEDKDKIETVWSGFAQAAANILMTVWQIDYNKSLKDIQRVFQRRWLEYNTFLTDDPTTSTIRILRGGILCPWGGPKDVAGLTLEFVFDNGKIETVTFIGTPGNPLSPEELARQVNEQLGFSTTDTPLANVRNDWILAFDYPNRLLRLTPNGTANSSFGFFSTAYMQNDLRAVDTYTPYEIYSFAYTPEFRSFPPGPQVNIEIHSTFDQGVNNDPGLPTYDLSYYGVGPEDVFTGTIIYPPNVPQDRIALRIKDIGLRPVYQRVSPVYLDVVLLDPIPAKYVPVDPAIGRVVIFRDWLIPSVVVSEVNDFTAQLISVGDLARFEVTPIATGVPTIVHCPVVGVAHERLGFNPAPLLMYYNGKPEDFTTTFVGVSRLKNVPVDALVVDIPCLQEVIKDPQSRLVGNKDYTITKIAGQNTIQFAPGTYSIGDPPPDRLWAEITYLDNSPAIEANFGTLVSFTASESTGISESLDYLSAVRGLWYAYFGGPSIENIRVGIHILLGLPFSEEAGIVKDINQNFSAKQGRIFIQDASNPALVRGYYYPTTSHLGLAINQETHKTIAVGDKIDQFAPLSTGVEVLDWLNGAEWGSVYGSVFSEVEKFFRFAIRANVDAFDIANLTFAIDFMLKFKPHYTYPTFIILKNVATPPDTIDVVDELTTTVRKLIVSTPDTKNIGAYRYDDDVSGEAFDPPHDSLYTDGECQQHFDAVNTSVKELSSSGLRIWPTSTLLPSGKVLVVGGAQSIEARAAELYDPRTKTFHSAAEPIVQRYQAAAVMVGAGYVLIAGGTDGSTSPVNSAELYSTVTGLFQSVGDMTDYRGSPTATVLDDGMVLVAGSGSADLYDPNTRTFSSVGSTIFYRDLFASVLLPNGMVLLTGGFDGSTITDTAELYDPATNEFVATGSMLTSRCYHTATLLQSGKVLITGGWSMSGPVGTSELYDPSTGTFSATGDLNVARGDFTASLLQDGSVLVVGGDVVGGSTPVVELYEPSSGRFIIVDQTTVANSGNAASVLLDGNVLIVGGIDWAIGALANAHLYDPVYFAHDRPLLFPATDELSVYVAEPLSGTPKFDSIWAFDDGGGMDIVPLSGPAPTPPPPPYGPLVGLLSFDMGLPGGLAGLTDGIYSRGWYL